MAITGLPKFSANPYKDKVALPQNFLQMSDYNALEPFVIDPDNVLHKPYVDSITGFLDAVVAKNYSHSQVIRWAEDRETNIVIKEATWDGTNTLTTANPHKLRKGIVVNVSDGSVIEKMMITATTTTTLTVSLYEAASALSTTAKAITIVEAYTDFLKGSYGMEEGLDPEYDYYQNTKQIVKESDIVSLTDSGEVLWLQVDGGWLWTFHKNAKTLKRFENKREYAFLDGIEATAGSAVAGLGLGNMKGAFAQTKERGITFGGHPTDIDEWKDLLTLLDKLGAIKNNSLWLNTEFDFDFSEMISDTSEIGYGVFQNGMDEAYSYDMRGFELGGYNIYKKKWNFLINNQGYGALEGAGQVEGFMFPLGNATVYNGENTGESASLPFLHVETSKDGYGNDRWLNINPNAADNDLDAKKITILSEFATKCVAAQNFVLFEKSGAY